MVRSLVRRGLTLFLILVGLLGCRAVIIPPDEEGTVASTTGVAPSATVPPATLRTIEVTRVVPQPVLVMATPAPTTPCAPVSADAAPVITIGALLPFSSPGALQAGFAMQTALNLAVLHLNDTGGINGTPIRLIPYDTAGTAERGAQFAERLSLSDCAVGLVGLYHSSVALAVIDVAHRYGIPVIVAAASSDEITARAYPEVFRVGASASQLTTMPAAWLAGVGDVNQDGELTAVLIGDATAATRTHLEQVTAHMESRGIAAETLTVDLPSNDFSGAVARILALPHAPDAIFLALKGAPALTLQSQLLAAGIGPDRATLIVLQQSGLESEPFWSAVPHGTRTVIARIGPWPGAITTHGLEFALKYDQQMGRWPEAHAFAAYDSLMVLVDALRRADSLAGDDVSAALRDTDLETTSGRVRFITHAGNAQSGDHAAHEFQQWLEPPTLYLQYRSPGQRATELPVLWPPRYQTGDLDLPAP